MNKPTRKITSNISATTKTEVSESILDLLKSTTLGTPGKLRYKHTNVEKHINGLKDLEFIQITKRNRVIGTAGLIKRNISIDNDEMSSLYVRYLSVLNPARKQKIKVQKSSALVSKKSKIRDQIASIFTNEFEKSFLSDQKSGLFYAYVEMDNLLSKNLCYSFGFREIRTVLTLLFSRFSPSNNPNVSILKNDQFNDFKSHVEEFYSTHNFVFTDSIEDHGKCFTYSKNSEVLGGLRAIPVTWKIIEMPGIKGFLIRKILPNLPFLNRIFNADKLNFLAFDSIWFEEEHSESIINIMEHACSHFKINLGMIWGDKESKVTTHLLRSKKLGILHKLNGTTKVKLMVRTINMDGEKNGNLTNKPVFVSAVDMA